MNEPASADDAAHGRQDLLLRAVIDHLPDFIYVKDLESRLLLTNVANLALMKVKSMDEVVGKTVFEFFPEHEARGFIEDDQRVIQSGQPLIDREEIITGKSGDVHYLLTTKVPFRDEAGKIIGLVGISRDVTRQKHAEQHIHFLNRTFAMLNETNQLMVRERNAVAILNGACEIAVRRGGFLMAWIGIIGADETIDIAAHAGASPETLARLKEIFSRPLPSCNFTYAALDTGLHAICDDIERDPRAESWRADALARGYRSMVSLPLVFNNRRSGVLNLYSSVPGFFDNDELKLLDGLALDIGFAMEVCEREKERQRALADLRRSEETLRQREERFRLMIENASDIITVIDYKGVIHYQSPSLQRILGHTPEDMCGHSAFEFIHAEDWPRVTDAIQRAIAANTPVSVEYRMRDRQGRWRTLQSIGLNAPGPDQQIIVNSRDITDHRRLEDQLRQSQKMEAIGQLAGGVAHDFNNILAAIVMQTELAQGMRFSSPEVREALDEIRSAAQRAANLTRQLLVFGRREVLQPRDLDLNDVVTSLAKMLQRIIGEDVELHLHLHPEPLITRADATMLDQTLMNLAINARDAMPNGGRLLISTAQRVVDEEFARLRPDAKPGKYVSFSVSDNGVGIPPEAMPHIFEPFFTTKEPGKGTGLGLATVFGIVQQHQGWLEVQSEPGKGAIFQIFLPARASLPRAASAPERPKPQGGRETILLAEDDFAVRGLLCAILQRNGYTVLEASNGVEAQKLWSEQADKIAMLITDLVMPEGVSGHQLARRLQANRPSLKVIYTSGYSADIAGRELQLRPGENFLSKPFDPLQLLTTIRKSLDS